MRRSTQRHTHTDATGAPATDASSGHRHEGERHAAFLRAVAVAMSHAYARVVVYPRHFQLRSFGSVGSSLHNLWHKIRRCRDCHWLWQVRYRGPRASVLEACLLSSPRRSRFRIDVLALLIRLWAGRDGPSGLMIFDQYLSSNNARPLVQSCHEAARYQCLNLIRR